jgi:LuxR family glucitol operon transcriptional activator
LEDIYTCIAVTLGREDINRARPEEQDDLVRQALTQQRTLLIVDNLETVDDERVMNFIREVPSPTKVIVTTRHRLDVAYPVRLMGMKEAEALTLISNEAKKKGVVLTEDEAIQLYKRTGGVPLAIVWSIAQIGFGYNTEIILARLGEPTGDIIKFCFEAALAQFKGKPAHKVLMVLSLFATSASREAIGQIAGFGRDILSRDEALVTLEKLSLIDKKSDRFYMLPLTKSLANSELQSIKENRDTFIERWIDFFINFAKERQETNRENLTQLAAEYENIGQVVNWLSVTKPQSKRLIELNRVMQSFLLSKGYWSDWGAWLEKAKEVAIVQNDELSLGYALYGMGLINVLRREPSKARQNLERSHHIFETYQRIPEMVRADIDLSRVYMFENKYEEAIQLLKDLEQLVYELNLPELIVFLHIRKGELLTELGTHDKKLGNFDEAISKLNEAKNNLLEALKIQGEREPTYGLNFIYWRLGVVFIEKENYQEAREYLSRSLDVARDLQMANGIAHAIGWLAVLNEKAKNLEEAQKLAIEAKDRFLSLRMVSHVKEMEELLKRISQ